MSLTTFAPLAQFDLGSENVTNFDRLIRARIGKQSLGLSPPGLMSVYLDWLVHLEFSPGKRLELLRSGLRNALQLALYAARSLADPGTPAHRGVGARGSPLHRSRVAPVAFQSLPTILPPDAAVVAGGNDKRVGCVAT